MRQLKGINVNQSFRKQKLIFEESWGDVLDRWVLYFLFGGGISYPAALLYREDLSSANDKFMAFVILPIIILFAIYVIYRKATEKNLHMVSTALSGEANMELLISFARSQGLKLHRKTKSLLILNEAIDSFNSSHKKTIVVVVQDNLIGFTMIKDQMKLNMPVLTSHLFLAKDLRRLFLPAREK